MLVDSKKKMLEPPEIILEAVKQTKSKYSPDQVLASVMSEVHDTGAILMREGNTLFVVHAAKDRTALFRALNADTAQNYLKNKLGHYLKRSFLRSQINRTKYFQYQNNSYYCLHLKTI